VLQGVVEPLRSKAPIPESLSASFSSRSRSPALLRSGWPCRGRTAEGHGSRARIPPDPFNRCKQRRLVQRRSRDPGARCKEEVADEEVLAEPDADAVVRVSGVW
jgi:hypothetical protein